jgi:predicted N-acetyltransferase YhbS
VGVEIREMRPSDYDAAYALWQATENVGLSDADSREMIQRCLRHSPGLSFVACDGGDLVGTVLGCDYGRRGMLLHLAVARDRRGRGIASSLVKRCLSAMKAAGLSRCNSMVFAGNTDGRAFWKHMGWQERPDVLWISREL